MEKLTAVNCFIGCHFICHILLRSKKCDNKIYLLRITPNVNWVTPDKLITPEMSKNFVYTSKIRERKQFREWWSRGSFRQNIISFYIFSPFFRFFWLKALTWNEFSVRYILFVLKLIIHNIYFIWINCEIKNNIVFWKKIF